MPKFAGMARQNRVKSGQVTEPQRRSSMDDSRSDFMKRQRKYLIPFLTICGMALAAALATQFAPAPVPAVPANGEKTAATPAPFVTVKYKFGRGHVGDSWHVYFNEPDASVDRSDYADGIDTPLASAIDAAERSLDIATFELNNRLIYEAILAAQRRGVAVRIVTDDRHGLEDDSDTSLRDLKAAGVAIVADNRSGLMHNKFTIVDARAVWTGSWNYTFNGTYRNNNNVLVLESAGVAAAYKTEFDEMFERGQFGARSSNDGPIYIKETAGEISIIFAPEAEEIAELVASIRDARSSIRVMSFVFSLGELAAAMIEKMADPDFVLQGIFEDRNSTASWSQMPALYCAGARVRQDGNRYVMHHKVIIIDDDTVITGSFNFSKSAAQDNDENIVIIRDRVIAGLYLDEWRRIWDSAQEVSERQPVKSAATKGDSLDIAAGAAATSWAGVQFHRALPSPAEPPCNTSARNPTWERATAALPFQADRRVRVLP